MNFKEAKEMDETVEKSPLEDFKLDENNENDNFEKDNNKNKKMEDIFNKLTIKKLYDPLIDEKSFK